MRVRSVAVIAALAVAALGLFAQGAEARPGRHHHRVCTTARGARMARCDASVVEADGSATPFVTNSTAYGITPAQMKSVYTWPTSLTAGTGKTIAIVDAYNAPTIANDLSVFSTRFGLPACTVASGCLRRVNQTGGTTLPANDSGWALEITMDVEWAHAIAPGAHILLIEAASPSLSNLFQAIDYANLHAQYVSMSWGSAEFSGERTFDSHLRQSGVSYFASAGDQGLPAEFPSSSAFVVSVGGTKLQGVGTSTVTQSAWSSGGGGCSAYEPVSPPQAKLPGYMNVHCTSRATPDLSADADPNTGVPVYDSTTYQNASGWFIGGGTSLSAPMVAARAADSGAVINYSLIYSTAMHFRDVKTGNNGAPCLYGYDLCSGRGSWVS
jgi:subtilase family serine protease